jgi:L-ribulose-5-phosphate 3-epimerase
MTDLLKLHGATLLNLTCMLAACIVPLIMFGSAEAGEHTGRIYKAVKFGMVRGDQSIVEKYKMLKELGYDGVESDSPGGPDKDEEAAASRETGLPIHGMVGSIHWHTRLSDPDPEVRAKATAGLRTAIIDAHRVGGTAVLLVPGQVNDPENENHDQVWQRSIVEIRKVLPLASRLGIHVLVENVGNGFCHDPHQFAAYIDEIDSPWVGVYFDIGNVKFVRKFGKPEDWIRILGRRIVKLDVKDWGQTNGFCKIGDGDVDWPEVRAALREIRYTGWATAEVAGGDRERLKEIAERMDRVLGL